MISADWARSLLCGEDEAGKRARLVSGSSGGDAGECGCRPSRVDWAGVGKSELVR